jgi:hypothetical protein
MARGFSEDELVEQPAIAVFKALDWDTANLKDEIDTQIYKTFAACGAITETEAQATSGEHLKRLLTENHRYVFTLIRKFRTASRSRTRPPSPCFTKTASLSLNSPMRT